MTYRLIAADLDHTLLRSDGTISDFTRDTIAACRKAGVEFTFATGRMYCSALPFAKQLGLALPLITYQGALLADTAGRVIHALHLQQELAGDIGEILRKSELHYNIYSDETLYFSTFGQEVLDYARHIGVQPLAVPRTLNQIAVTQFGVFAEPDQVAQLQQDMVSQFGDAVHTVISGGKFLEICHPEARKSYGLAKLAEQMEIDRSAIIAFGDNHNDLDMLRYAGTGVAVANAVPAAKAVADRFTASNDEDGVARLLHELFL